MDMIACEDAMTKLDLFNELIRKSIKSSDEKTFEVSNKRFYYPNKYAKGIENYYRYTKRESKEFNSFQTSWGYECFKICSVASSARLAFLKLALKRNIKFEWHLVNGATKTKKEWNGPKRNDAQLDAYDGNSFYECKCQEILETKTKLSKSYYPLLKEYFEIEINNSSQKNYVPSLKEMKIDNSNKKYTETLFDIKQLFTHLCAIIKCNNELQRDVKLHYIFFKPSDKHLKETPLESLYDELEKEIKAIKTSDVIKKAKDRFHIDFVCEIVDVGDEIFTKEPSDIYLEFIKNRP